MSPSGEVTQWIRQLQASDRQAVQKLWETYYQRLVSFARKKMQELPRRAADEEDVALSAFDSFCRGAERGRFPRLEDRDDLWQVLVMIVSRKAVDLAVHEGRDKRDWRRTQELSGNAGDASGPLLRRLISRELDPGFASQLVEESQRLLAQLPDDQLRQIAQNKMEGYTNEEIALHLGVSLATVERRVALLRKSWAQLLTADTNSSGKT
jgi:DNA-directed RNA polymerase specialized sigma24 family protein